MGNFPYCVPVAAGIVDVFMINRSLPDLMMGVENSIPPFEMDAAAPKVAPRRPQLPDSWKPYLPRCAPRGALRRGAIMSAVFMVPV